MKCSLCDKETNVMAIGIKVKNLVNICTDCWKLFCAGLYANIVNRTSVIQGDGLEESKTNYWGTYYQLSNLTKTPTKDIDLDTVL